MSCKYSRQGKGSQLISKKKAKLDLNLHERLQRQLCIIIIIAWCQVFLLSFEAIYIASPGGGQIKGNTCHRGYKYVTLTKG